VAEVTSTSDGVLAADVPIQHQPTLYSRIGDIFGWLCLAAFAGVTIRAVARPSRG